MMVHLLLIIGSLFIFWFPGFITILSFNHKKSSELIFIYSIAISIIISSWVALICAQISIFYISLLISVLSIYSILLCIFKYRYIYNNFKQLKVPNLFYSILLLIIFFLSISFLYLKPGEYLIGGWDPGVDINVGANIAHKHSIIYQDHLLTFFNQKDLQILYPYAKSIGIKYPGMYIYDFKKGLLVPQFYHMYPVWLAIFYSIFSNKAILFVNPFFALFNIILFYCLMVNFRGKKFALFATLFFALNPIQIWNARFSTSEVLTQTYFLVGFILLFDYIRYHFSIFGIFAGIAFGLAILTTPTSLLFIPVLFLFLIISYNSIGSYKYFMASFIVILMHFTFQTFFIAKKYTQLILSFFSISNIFILVGIIFISFLLIFKTKWIHYIVKFFKKYSYMRILSLSFFIYLLLYLLFPDLLSKNNGLNKLLWFITLPSFFVGILGSIYISWTSKDSVEWLFFLTAILFMVFFIYDPRMIPTYPFTLRRFIPVVIPWLSMCIALIPFLLYELNSQRYKLVAIIVSIFIIIYPLYKNRILITHIDYKGFFKFIKEYQRQVPNNKIIFCDNRWLGYPLELFFKKKIIILPQFDISIAHNFIELLTRISKHNQVYYISFKERPFSERLVFKPIYKKRLVTSRLEQDKYRYPRVIKNIDMPFTLYKIVPIQSRRDTIEQFPIKVDIGENTIGLWGGFGQAVRFLEKGFCLRWTGRRMKLPLPSIEDKENLFLQLKMKSPRPSNIQRAEIKVELNAKPLNEFILPRNNYWTTYKIALPGLHDHPKEIKFSFNTWNPEHAGISYDNRDLGVAISDMELYRIKDKKTCLVYRYPLCSMKSSEEEFHEVEWEATNTWARWTLDYAEIVLPWPIYADYIEMSIRMGAGEKRASPAFASIGINNTLLVYNLEVLQKMNIYRLKIPASYIVPTGNRVRLKILSSTWDPLKKGLKGYRHNLGLLIDWIKIVPLCSLK